MASIEQQHVCRRTIDNLQGHGTLKKTLQILSHMCRFPRRHSQNPDSPCAFMAQAFKVTWLGGPGQDRQQRFQRSRACSSASVPEKREFISVLASFAQSRGGPVSGLLSELEGGVPEEDADALPVEGASVNKTVEKQDKQEPPKNPMRAFHDGLRLGNHNSEASPSLPAPLGASWPCTTQ